MSEETKNENLHGTDASEAADIIDEGEYLEWLKFSQMDYSSAKYLFDSPLHPRPLEIICYHSQQSAEKAVKALIVFYGEPGGMPKVHNISFLLNQIKNLVKERTGREIPAEVYDCADRLTQYSVMPRYPNEIEVDEPMTRKALEDATDLINWVNGIIETSGREKPIET